MNNNDSNPAFSIVTTVYRSLPYLDAFVERSLEALSAAGFSDYEMIFVVDGSPDQSLDKLISLSNSNPNIRVIELSRNFGHHNATKAGLVEARGEMVFLIDCDMETSPLVLVDFYNTMKQTDADVVYGFQQKRKGNWFEQFSGNIFWKFISAMSDVSIPANIVTERLMKRAYVQELIALGDRNLFYGGLFHWVGFHQVGVPVQKVKRAGRSNYGLFRKLSLMVNAVTSFSIAPLKMILNIGLVISLLSFGYGFALVLKKMLYPESLLLGWTSIITLIFFFFGIIITILGFMGIYIAKMYTQVQGRPTFIVRRKYN